MQIMDLFLAIIFSLLFIRTLSWHLQNWQIREYRWDRIRTYFCTKEGIINIFNLWFFRGIFPRPKISLRLILITCILIFLIFGHFCLVNYVFKNCETSSFCVFPRTFVAIPWWWKILLYERLLFIFITLSVFISNIPIFISKKILFYQAQKIAKNSKILKIAIAGSFGKSSTKEILIHLLQKEFGAKNILYNPANQNHEISIARLIKKNHNFFTKNSKTKKICVIETGAYSRGEIKQVMDFLSPQTGILTGIGTQHLSLFGSEKNIKLAKFELAEGVRDQVFFNADNEILSQVFADKKISATPIGLSKKIVQKINSKIDKTEFELYGKKFVLPWGGEFFLNNAILAIEVSRELGISIENLAKNLKTLPKLERALEISKNSNQIYILKDLYSANADGVLSAIKHLNLTTGEKIFVGTPLLELGKKSQEIHEQIFYSLKNIKAKVWWCKDDFVKLGKKILGKNFHQIEVNNLNKLKDFAKKLEKTDAVLLEGRLNNKIVEIFK